MRSLANKLFTYLLGNITCADGHKTKFAKTIFSQINQVGRLLPVSFVAGVVLLGVTGCGTMFYPERKGQIDGKIDPTVATLDSLSLLALIIPGAVAFMVDFDNGTIYLPKNYDESPPDKQ